MKNSVHIFLALLALATAGGQVGWPEVFDPFQVATIYLDLPAADWNEVLHDTDFYDVTSDIRKSAKMCGEGLVAPNSLATAITVQIRRKSDPALPDETNALKILLKIDVNEYIVGQKWRGLKKISLENGSGNGVLKECFASRERPSGIKNPRPVSDGFS